MNLKVFCLLGFCGLIISCKPNFMGKEMHYSTENNSEFNMIFINDTVLEIMPKVSVDNTKKIKYKFKLLEKESLKTITENQPTVNFKTKKLYGQFYQKIPIELVNGENLYFKKIDTLNYVKMRMDGKMTERIYFDNGNKFIEL